MQGGVYALRYLRSVVGSIQETVNVTAFVCARQEIVETPHIQLSPLTAEVFIADIGFCHRVNLCVSNE